MRVTLVCLNYPPEPTGISLYSGGLAEGLVERGWQVNVVTGLPHYPQWRVQKGFPAGRSEPRERLTLTRREHPVPAEPRLLNRLRMEVAFGVSATLARWGRPDVVVLISPALFSSLLAAVRARLQRRPYVVWVQDIYSLGVSETGAAGRWAERLLGLAERLLLRNAAAVVAIHERFKSTLVNDLGIKAERVKVVRNWSHLDLTVHTSRTDIRARLGWSDDVYVVLHAGNMGAKQGLENVVAASRLAASEGQRLLFVLMGDGNRRPELEAAEGNPCLQFRDPLPPEEFLDALRAADALLVNERPGLSEMAVPSKLTSYFAAERPVIAATDAASVTAQEIKHSEAGIRVDADAPAQLVAAVLKLAEQPQLAAELGRRGAGFRQAHLTPEAALGALSEVLHETARPRSSEAS